MKGYVTGHFRRLSGEPLEELLARLAQPHADPVQRLCMIPGVDRVTASTPKFWTRYAG